MDFKPYAKIGKETLKRILMTHTNTPEKKDVMGVKYLIDLNNKFNCHCSKCPLVKASTIEKEIYCSEHCDNFKKYTWSDVEFTNDGIVVKNNKSFCISRTSKRLSRLSILLLVSLHFCSSIDSNGIIKNVDLNEIAEKLNCSVRAVLISAQSLVKYGFIYLAKISTCKYSIKIVSYTSYHLTAIEGGMGYLNVTGDMLNNLISIKDVNCVRSTITLILDQDEGKLKEKRKQKKLDNVKPAVSVNVQGKITIKDFKQRLPKHISNIKLSKVINQDKLREIVNCKIENNVLYYSFNDKYNTDTYKESIKEQYLKQINDYLNKSTVYSETKDQKDLLQMSLQYGIDVVLRYLPIAEEEILDRDYMGNYCGLLRNVISKGFSEYAA